MKRIIYLDAAKAFGIFLVYYGHVLDRLYDGGADAAYIQLKLVYSFHMPFFFFLSGIFWKPNDQTAGAAIGKKFKTRIVPTLFFGLIAIPLWMAAKTPASEMLTRASGYISGSPAFNWLTWFLVCLFTTELILTIFGGYFSLKGKPRLYIYAALFFIVGTLVTENAYSIAYSVGVKKNFWFINEAVIAAAFYILGYSIKEELFAPLRLPKELIIVAVSGLLFFSTFDLNQGPFTGRLHVVTMTSSVHGNPFWFLLTACSGSVFIIYCMRLLQLNMRFVRFVGRNTLVYMGLNGISLHFMDPWLIKFIGYKPVTGLSVLLYGVVYVAVVMILFAPIVYLLERYMPEFVGVKMRDSSLLPPMKSWRENRFVKSVTGICRGNDFR